jgi:prepilin-type N-terminal cleavage/methylation domain-containing protein
MSKTSIFTPKSQKNKGNQGFSILEVLIAITIVSFTIIPIISMWRYTSQANIKSINAIHSSTLAVQRIEHFKFGGTIPPSPGVNVAAIGEFKRLKLLMEEEAAPVGSPFNPLKPKWKPYEKIEEYGTIPLFPNHKRYTRITFFPEELPDPEQYAENLLAPEYIRMTSRLKIYVKVTWVENADDQGNTLKERTYAMFTVVSNKE